MATTASREAERRVHVPEYAPHVFAHGRTTLKSEAVGADQLRKFDTRKPLPVWSGTDFLIYECVLELWESAACGDIVAHSMQEAHDSGRQPFINFATVRSKVSC